MDQFIKTEILSKIDIILEVLKRLRDVLSELIYPTPPAPPSSPVPEKEEPKDKVNVE